MLEIFAESIFVATRLTGPREHARAPLVASRGWLQRLLRGRR